MKTVRPGLSIATGVFAIFQLLTSVPALVLTALVADFNHWWGFGGSIGAIVASLFGIVGGFGRFRWMLIFYAMISLVSSAFMIATSALVWQGLSAGIALLPIVAAASALCFVAAVFAFFGSIIGFAAAASRRRTAGTTTTEPAYRVEEKYRARVIRQNRTVLAFSIINMLIAIPLIVLSAIDGVYPSWWTFAAGIGFLVASIFGIVAGVRARRGMHMLNALTSFLATGIVWVGVGLWFRFLTAGTILNPIQLAILSLGFVLGVFGFINGLISMATYFMYRRRTTTAAAYPTATATAAQPTVVVGEESAWQAPGISPRTVPAQPGQTVAEARTIVEPAGARFGQPPVPTVPTRV